MTRNGTTGKAEYRTLQGRRVVILDPAEYERLRAKADEFEPPLPAADAAGNYPAVEALRVALARKILRHRRRAGLSQTELARRARIRTSTLDRIEQAKVSPTPSTIAKIEMALRQAAAD